jgi:hypothetical protein
MAHSNAAVARKSLSAGPVRCIIILTQEAYSGQMHTKGTLSSHKNHTEQGSMLPRQAQPVARSFHGHRGCAVRVIGLIPGMRPPAGTL